MHSGKSSSSSSSSPAIIRHHLCQIIMICVCMKVWYNIVISIIIIVKVAFWNWNYFSGLFVCVTACCCGWPKDIIFCSYDDDSQRVFHLLQHNWFGLYCYFAAAIMNKKPPLPITAFIGGPQTNAASIAANNASNSATASMCFSTPAKSEKQRDHHQANAANSGLCGCHKAPKSHCISATGRWYTCIYT